MPECAPVPRLSSRWKWAALASVPMLVALLWFYYAHDPAASGLFPRCLFHEFTGLLCPGCGLQRAFHEVLHGRVIRAIGYNPLAFMAAGVLAWHALARLQKRQSPLEHRVAGRATLAIVLAFWIGRNLIGLMTG